jgi:hypothetical protein
MTCANQVLKNVCPNCGGGFVARPIRPTVDRRVGVSLDYQTPSIERVHTKYSMEELKQFSAEVKHIKPEER